MNNNNDKIQRSDGNHDINKLTIMSNGKFPEVENITEEMTKFKSTRVQNLKFIILLVLY